MPRNETAGLRRPVSYWSVGCLVLVEASKGKSGRGARPSSMQAPNVGRCEAEGQ